MEAGMTWMSALLVVCLAGLSPQAKAPVDFSGTWTFTSVTPAPASSASGVAALAPSDIVIRQTPGSVAIERTAFGQVITQTISLDGREDTNKSGATVFVSRSRWEKSTLVTEGKRNQMTSQGYDEWTVHEARSLNAKGQLVIELRT